MSFGFPEPIKEISEAIKHANEKHTIMLAAASNGGLILKETFPATCSEVISIRSADVDGQPSRFNPNLPAAQDRIYSNYFNTIGEYVLSAWPRHKDAEGLKRQTGSSIATPIAAAVAATFLDYVRARLWEIRDPEARRHFWYQIRHTPCAHGIRKALVLMTESEPSQGLYLIKPWLLMSSKSAARWEKLKEKFDIS